MFFRSDYKIPSSVCVFFDTESWANDELEKEWREKKLENNIFISEMFKAASCVPSLI